MLFCGVILLLHGCGEGTGQRERVESEEYPGEWFYQQRAFPQDRIRQDVYAAAASEARRRQEQSGRSQMEAWTPVGPYNVGGRITDIALHPTDPSTLYVATANGGAFRTSDAGVTWEHVYLTQGPLPIGNIEISPSDPAVLYIGTGEANGSATSGAFPGNGVYRSADGGDTWTHVGLADVQHIGRVIIDPSDPDHVCVAATGILYGKNAGRGIYRTFNGGTDWEQVLFVSDSTSAIDIAMDPAHPDTLFAATWDRIRYPNIRDYAGLSSGLYRSTDGGDTWMRLETGGFPVSEEIGRIGVTVAQDGTVYASVAFGAIANEFMGLFRSDDSGDSWIKINDTSLDEEEVNSGFGWYFGNVRTDPHDPDNVYIVAFQTYESQDKGVSWTRHNTPIVHVDHHAFEIHPLNQSLQYLGTDGGLYVTKNRGNSWTHLDNLPVTEFYTCEIDETLPHRRYGGAQDNGTNRTLTGDVDDWERIFGGDGFVVLVDPTDTNTIYCEYQWGFLYKSTDGGFDWDYSLEGVDGFDRTSWNTPYEIAPLNHRRLYYGTHRLYTSVDGAENWTVISDDLTNTDPASPGGEDFGALSAIGLAVSDSNVIYTGSEDGVVSVTFDQGVEWKRISDDLPTRYITRIAVDPEDAMVAYVTISGYRELDYLPHIFMTPDGGDSWIDISGDLPEVPLNDVIIDPDFPGTLYVASDLGVWYTGNMGVSWNPLGTDLPLTAITDLDFHRDTRLLLAASFGLSMYTYDLSEPITPTRETPGDPFDELTVFPNPISGAGHIMLTLNRAEHVRIALFNVDGMEVRELTNTILTAGRNSVPFVLPDLSPGAYVLRLTTNSGGAASRVLILY